MFNIFLNIVYSTLHKQQKKLW